MSAIPFFHNTKNVKRKTEKFKMPQSRLVKSQLTIDPAVFSKKNVSWQSNSNSMLIINFSIAPGNILQKSQELANTLEHHYFLHSIQCILM